MSLAEKLASLANRAPVYLDPEDDQDVDATAKLTDFNEDGFVETGTKSILRLQNTAPLDDDNERYAGKKVSRQKLQVNFSFNEYGGEESSYIPAKVIEKETDVKSDEDSDDYDDDDDDDEQLQDFQKAIQKISPKKMETNKMEVSGSESDEDGSIDDLSENDKDDTDDGDESGDESGSDEEAIQTFSKVNIDDDAEKGSAIKSQLKVWDGLLECRIRLHKSLVAANQLPQHDVWPSFAKVGEQQFANMVQSCQSSTTTLLSSLIELQTILLDQNPETNKLAKSANNVKVTTKTGDSDEEITSESEVETEKTDTTVVEPRQRKRKLKMPDYSEVVEKRHAEFESFRNSAIQTWNDRTKVTTGKVKKSFENFEHSAVRRIEQILFDRERLIERTQLKRDFYKTLGKEAPIITEESSVKDKQNIKKRTLGHDSHLKDYDKEIFDDGDFYHHLLRELIEHKTIDPHSPNIVVKQWLDIQKMRKNMKKTVDVKASKGRKIRYDVHSKLVSFMAPRNDCALEEQSRLELFKSLFGKRTANVVPVENIRLFKGNKPVHLE